MSTPAPSRLSFAFSSEGERSFGAYHDIYAGGSTVTRLGGDFGASLKVYRLPRLVLFERQITGVAHHRDAARARRDGFDHFTLQLLRGGRMQAGPPGAERAMTPGDIAVFDTSRPHRTVVECADYVVVSLPRDVVEATLPDARRLHGAVLPRAASGLLGDFLLSLARNAPALKDGLAGRAGAMMADLLSSAASDRPSSAGSEAADLSGLQRARAEDYIEAHLGDPSLGVERVAAALGQSRSTLYRAFAPVDGVARHITALRVRRLGAALRLADERRSVAALALACGFASESHCSRAFKAVHGIAPGQFRAESQRRRTFRQQQFGVDELTGLMRELY